MQELCVNRSFYKIRVLGLTEGHSFNDLSIRKRKFEIASVNGLKKMNRTYLIDMSDNFKMIMSFLKSQMFFDCFVCATFK